MRMKAAVRMSQITTNITMTTIIMTTHTPPVFAVFILTCMMVGDIMTLIIPTCIGTITPHHLGA